MSSIESYDVMFNLLSNVSPREVKWLTQNNSSKR